MAFLHGARVGGHTRAGRRAPPPQGVNTSNGLHTQETPRRRGIGQPGSRIGRPPAAARRRESAYARRHGFASNRRTRRVRRSMNVRLVVMAGRGMDAQRLLEAHRHEHPYSLHPRRPRRQEPQVPRRWAWRLVFHPHRTAVTPVSPEMALLRGELRFDSLRRKLNLPCGRRASNSEGSVAPRGR